MDLSSRSIEITPLEIGTTAQHHASRLARDPYSGSVFGCGLDVRIDFSFDNAGIASFLAALGCSD